MLRLTDPLISLQEATRHVPGRDGPHASYETLRRWATKGYRGVRLETLRIGGRMMTTTEALQRFFEALSVRPTFNPSEDEKARGESDYAAFLKEFDGPLRSSRSARRR